MQLAYVITLSDEVHAFASGLYQVIMSEAGVNNALVFEPHITLKLPFETETVEPFERLLDDLTLELSPFDLHINGIARWDEGIIYLDMVQDERLKTARRRLVAACQALGIQPLPIEDKRFHYHVTVGSGLPAEALARVWDKLKVTPVDYHTPFDRLTLVGNGGEGWQVYRDAKLHDKDA